VGISLGAQAGQEGETAEADQRQMLISHLGG